MTRVLITGGAGFIGSHLADELLEHGYEVRALDVLDEQVHGPLGERPEHLDPRVELIVGDVADPSAVRYCLEGVEAVVHLAARVGVGQSMYEAVAYSRVNTLGTAVLMEALEESDVERLVVASSMSIYGEGLYIGPDGRLHSSIRRDRAQLQGRRWEPVDEKGRALSPVATPEWKPPDLASVSALTKYDQERMCLLLGEARSIPTVALRLFNVYGPRQALSNPRTGVLAIFVSRLLNGRPPLVFEDGLQRRDFVHVRDVARAFRLALERPVGAETINIGAGRSFTIAQIAQRLARVMQRDIEPEIIGSFRGGDIRHCFADGGKATDVLGFQAEVDFDAGLSDLASWLDGDGQGAADHVEYAHDQLARRGMRI
ncbi:MAG TPA: NAD-dependent epimerase/dehydratase family protein [Longimicrobiales bacterium]|nr:NAD-dependent epimerase/dehydratase family protein [Longimicrobiales bacterium]